MIARDPRTPAIVTVLTTIGFFGVLIFVLINGLPDSGRDAALIMLGTLGTAWTSCVSYYVGSSSGSARKTDALERIAGSSNQP